MGLVNQQLVILQLRILCQLYEYLTKYFRQRQTNRHIVTHLPNHVFLHTNIHTINIQTQIYRHTYHRKNWDAYIHGNQSHKKYIQVLHQLCHYHFWVPMGVCSLQETFSHLIACLCFSVQLMLPLAFFCEHFSSQEVSETLETEAMISHHLKHLKLHCTASLSTKFCVFAVIAKTCMFCNYNEHIEKTWNHHTRREYKGLEFRWRSNFSSGTEQKSPESIESDSIETELYSDLSLKVTL